MPALLIGRQAVGRGGSVGVGCTEGREAKHKLRIEKIYDEEILK
jgi:hypothetical protein